MAPSFKQKSSSSDSKRGKKLKVDIPEASHSPKSVGSGKAAAKRASRQAKAVDPSRRKSIADKAAKKSSKQAARQSKAADKAKAKKSKDDQAAIKKAAKSTDKAAERARGRRVGDIRAADRAERARRRYRAYVIRIAIVAVAIVAIIFGSVFLYRSNAFAIKTVNVTGVWHLTSEEITQLAAVPDDSTILRIDSEGISERLETHPWIQEAHVRRHFPDTVELVVTERTPAAAVRINEKSIWVISTDGAWLSAATEDDWNENRRIVDVNAAIDEPVAGNECGDEGIVNAVAIFDGVSAELAAEIDSISAESPVKAALNLKGGVVVAFGEADNIELKEAAIWSLLKEYEGSISYINVRIPERPTFRTM